MAAEGDDDHAGVRRRRRLHGSVIAPVLAVHLQTRTFVPIKCYKEANRRVGVPEADGRSRSTTYGCETLGKPRASPGPALLPPRGPRGAGVRAADRQVTARQPLSLSLLVAVCSRGPWTWGGRDAFSAEAPKHSAHSCAAPTCVRF